MDCMNDQSPALQLSSDLLTCVQIDPHVSGDEPGGHRTVEDHLFDGAATELRRLYAENQSLKSELERERLRLTACGVIALANTPESAENARQIRVEYSSGSARDVADAVDREMKYRHQLNHLKSVVQDMADFWYTSGEYQDMANAAIRKLESEPT